MTLVRNTPRQQILAGPNIPVRMHNLQGMVLDIGALQDAVDSLQTGTEAVPLITTDATQSTSSTTGSIVGAGGLGIAKDANIAGKITVVGKATVAGIVRKPVGTTVAASALISGAMIASGYIEVTGTTNSSALDTFTNIAAAIGVSTAGSSVEFIINTIGTVPMTAGNVLTITADATGSFLKQTSAGDSASSQLATVTATAGVHVGTFRITFDTITSYVVQRIG